LPQVSTSNNVVRLVSLADRERRWALRGVSTVLADPPQPAPGSSGGRSSRLGGGGGGARVCLLAAEPPELLSADASAGRHSFGRLLGAAAAADASQEAAARSCRLLVNGHPGALQVRIE
jgi:hypothetical protein